jgi:hypothetical protein
MAMKRDASRAPDAQLRDYNGEGPWSREGILARYRAYCRALGIKQPLDLRPQEHREGSVHWVYPLMDPVIRGIEAGDRACIALGVDFIEEDRPFPFGRALKSNTARALRRASLDASQQERVRTRVIAMLLGGNVPREFKQYAKLLRQVGLGDRWSDIERNVSRDNPHVMRWFHYLQQHAHGKPATTKAAP